MAGLDWLGSALGGLFGLAGSAMNQMMSYKDNKKLQENQARLNYDNSVRLSQWSAENMPSMNRAGLTKAGYNPMLAVQNATSGANAGSFAGTASTQPVDYMSGVSAGVANAQSLQRLTNETKTAEAQQDQAYAMADKAKVEKNTLVQKLPYVSQREKAEIANVEKDSLLKESQIHNIDETTRFIEKNYELQKMLGLAGIDVQRSAVGAQIYSANKSYNASTYGRDIELEKTKRYNDWARKHPYTASLSETVDRHFGALLGAGAGLGAGLRLGKLKFGKRKVGF